MTKKHRTFNTIDILLFSITLICSFVLARNIFFEREITKINWVLSLALPFLYTLFGSILFSKTNNKKHLIESNEQVGENKECKFDLIYASQKARNKDKYMMCRSIAKSMGIINLDIDSLIESNEDFVLSEAQDHEGNIKSEAENMYSFLNQLILDIEDDNNALEQIKTIVENSVSN